MPETAAAPPAPRRWSTARWGAPPLLAAAATSAVFVAAGVIRRTVPFGPVSRSINDLGNQFLPLHALLWDMLHGTAPGDLQLNWNSAAGVPFLPDYVTYLASPLAPLVALFPRDRIELAVYVITVLKLALASAMMTVYLRRVRPAGPAWVAAGLAAAYGVCGWAIDDAAYVPMWLDGLVALPALALVGEWARERRHPLLGPAVVFLAWFANFYTAWMASIAACVLLLARIVGARDGVKDALLTVARTGWYFVLGVGASAATLVPLFAAVHRSQPSPPGSFHAAPWSVFAARLLPLSEGVGTSPGLYAGTAALLLAATLPWHRAVPRLVRLAYPVGLVLLVLSMRWPPTQSAWHGFDTPNGSPYRQAFVVCAWLVVMAWLALADGRPGLPALAAGVVTLGGLVLLARRAATLDLNSSLTPAVVLVSAAVLLLAVLLLGRRRPALLSLVLVLIVLVEGTATAVYVDEHRLSVLSTRPSVGPAAAVVHDTAAAASTWPRQRLIGSATAFSGNDPALFGYPGTTYYSSTVDAATSQALIGLGVPWAGYGRGLMPGDDPGLPAVLAAGARLSVTSHDGRYAASITPLPAHPLVTVLTAPRRGGDPDSPFVRRDELMNVPAYVLAPVRAAVGRQPVADVSAAPFTAMGPGPMTGTLTTTCPAGSTVQLFAPTLTGTATLAGSRPVLVLPSGAIGAGVRQGAGVVDLGSAPANGQVSVRLASTARLRLPPRPLGCLDPAALDRDAALAQAQQPAIHVDGAHVQARWPAPMSGEAVVATTSVTGWTCRVDGHPAAAGSRAGLLAVTLSGATALGCDYQTPGLRTGLAVSLGALLLILLAGSLGAALRWRRSRRRAGPDSAAG